MLTSKLTLCLDSIYNTQHSTVGVLASLKTSLCSNEQILCWINSLLKRWYKIGTYLKLVKTYLYYHYIVNWIADKKQSHNADKLETPSSSILRQHGQEGWEG